MGHSGNQLFSEQVFCGRTWFSRFIMKCFLTLTLAAILALTLVPSGSEAGRIEECTCNQTCENGPCTATLKDGTKQTVPNCEPGTDYLECACSGGCYYTCYRTDPTTGQKTRVDKC